MTKSIIHAAAAVLQEGLGATIDLQGLAGGRVKLTYTPNIGPTPDNASADIINLRSAMARPFVVSGTADEIEAAFADRVASSAQVVQRGLTALDEIERLASAAVEKARSKATPAAQAPAAAPEDDGDDDGDDDADEQGGGTQAPVAPAGTTTRPSF